jgi:group I intron endonuclease
MHVYKFTHIATGRSYIGQTIQDPNRRRLEHIADSRHTSKEYHFHNAIRKYGIDAFTFEVIDTATTLTELNLLEEQYVAQYDSINNGFNIRQAGGNKLHSEESKQRMSEAQKSAHARRKLENGGVEKHNTHKHKGTTGMWTYSAEQKAQHSNRMKEINKRTAGGKTWKVIDGKRTWIAKEAVV